MASSGTAKILLAVAITMVVVAPAVDAAISCNTVASKLVPCINYARGKGPLTPECCNGIRSLNSLASNTQDRQTACKCLKSAATSIKDIDLGRVAGLPGQCKVNIPYKLDPNTDCSKVK